MTQAIEAAKLAFFLWLCEVWEHGACHRYTLAPVDMEVMWETFSL